MRSGLFGEITTSLGDKEWPQDVGLYRSLEEQEILVDKAKCYVVKAFLYIHNVLNQTREYRRINARDMCVKKDTLPFLQVLNTIVGEDDFLYFLNQKDLDLDCNLPVEKILFINGLISIIKTKLIPIELYALWMVGANKKKTLDCYGFGHPEPLKKMLCYQKCKEVEQFLKIAGYFNKSKAQVITELSKILDLFAKKLEKNKYISGNEISNADVFIYGHIQAILESKLDDNFLLETLKNFPILEKFCISFSHNNLGNQSLLGSIFEDCA
ncbi:metaxin-2 homolog [Hydra vulgaris]|uniref:Metaxin-2 n=1 Tax=Hydra vulgaris TaxID=6087 RepID=T2MIP1_HYDVU|nr:metaxin-2 homolog [Hydra vulgaris]XP_047136655.1 metaxin-2 homolog [Hydra vulgaris]